MNRPSKDAKRHSIYVVKSVNNAAGRYIGETDDLVVLQVGDTVRGFPWKEVDPVQVKETGPPAIAPSA